MRITIQRDIVVAGLVLEAGHDAEDVLDPGLDPVPDPDTEDLDHVPGVAGHPLGRAGGGQLLQCFTCLHAFILLLS